MPEQISGKPHQTTFDNQFIELESVDSTNNYAMARIHEGMASGGMVILAKHQWAGKGQRGKNWLSEPGENLIMSLIVETSAFELANQFLFSTSVALGILDFCRSVKVDGWSIKWPNDIYWNDRKAAGILIENSILGQKWCYAVVGIGLNLNQVKYPAEISNAISLCQISGKNFIPMEIARILVPQLQSRIYQLVQNSSSVFSSYNQNLYKKDQVVNLIFQKKNIKTRILGTNEKGLLLTEAGNFSLGEVEWNNLKD